MSCLQAWTRAGDTPWVSCSCHSAGGKCRHGLAGAGVGSSAPLRGQRWRRSWVQALCAGKQRKTRSAGKRLQAAQTRRAKGASCTVNRCAACAQHTSCMHACMLTSTELFTTHANVMTVITADDESGDLHGWQHHMVQVACNCCHHPEYGRSMVPGSKSLSPSAACCDLGASAAGLDVFAAAITPVTLLAAVKSSTP